MTEQEAIGQFKERLAIEEFRQQIPEYYEAMEIAVKSLEEIQKYRQLGTFEKLNSLITQSEQDREAMERQKAKKPIIKYKQTQDCLTEIEWKCPTCGANYIELTPCGEWCRYCGTKFDWSEEE